MFSKVTVNQYSDCGKKKTRTIVVPCYTDNNNTLLNKIGLSVLENAIFEKNDGVDTTQYRK